MVRTRTEGRIECGIGAGLLAFGALFYFAWLTDTSGHGERAFLLLPAFALIPPGLGFLLGGAAVWAQIPGWRVFRWAPIAGVCVVVATCTRVFS